MLKSWALEIKDQCLDKKVPFFFKQEGGLNKKCWTKIGRPAGTRCL
jgi:protein gp37